MERIAPSAALEAQISDLLSRGIDDSGFSCTDVGRVG